MNTKPTYQDNYEQVVSLLASLQAKVEAHKAQLETQPVDQGFFIGDLEYIKAGLQRLDGFLNA